MNSSPTFDHESFAQRHRGGILLERYGLDLYPHPYLGFSLAPGHRSAVINTDDEGFRLSDSPFGTIDSTTWISGGGGGLVLGNSVAIGLAASSDSTTPASYLASLTGSRQLNLGVCAANSLQELIAALPFLHAASTVVIIGGGPDYINMVSSRSPDTVFGPISYEQTLEELARTPLFDLAPLASKEAPAEVEIQRLSPRKSPPWYLSDAVPRMEAATDRRLRNLEFLTRAAPDRTRFLFCLQPIVTPRTRTLTLEEQERYDFDAPVFGILHSTCEKHWDEYANRLAKGCADLGVSFLNMSADSFIGDSFADTLHLIDEGNRQAAQMIHRALEEASAAQSVLPSQ